ncbi:hypothetical protein BP5796_01566 [Coleophoma crateriformis]|uniref:Maintenance of telomere capping protein 6 n=1 Tax=Coleophoma crateriformis TaxID=565419 RepID=A0A3D8T0S3_9HELO|nr:hypothetical protein BP5796_01566 [Coleophoma crateriformis]
MTEMFTPDDGAVPVPPLTTVFLSQRDLGLTVPINYVTQPGVSFSAACFPFHRYDDDDAGDCLSNLLADGFRRFEIDLYWDEERQIWSFCPVAIPTSIPNAAPSSTVTLSFQPSTASSFRSGSLAASSSTSDSASSTSTSSVSSSITKSAISSAAGLGARQATSTADAGTGISATSLGTTLPTASVLPDSDNNPLVEISPYICTPTINLLTFTSLILDYVKKTETDLGAHLIYVIMNLHAAASDMSPTAPAPSVTKLPTSGNLLSSLWSSNLSAYLYTPDNLRSDRANLNGSWYTVAPRYRPVDGYYRTTRTVNNIFTTEDGWPSEGYIELSRSKRLLLGHGTHDPQLAGYNFTGDQATIFPEGYIQASQSNLVVTSTDAVTSGCFRSNITDDLSRVNASWATLSNGDGTGFTTTSALTPLLNLTSNITDCGISPILNVTLLNATAREDYKPYQRYSYSTIWSWAPNEPKNTSSNTADDLFRCAISRPGLLGRWAVGDCSQKLFASCRALEQPYNWTLTTYQMSYSFASQACQYPYKFAAPRTALENAYLFQAMQASNRDFDGNGAWVDYNNLDVKGCWTMGGQNATCPYSGSTTSANDLKRKTVLVPTIAALIVLIVTVLTVLAKVAGNRKTNRRRNKRAHNGFVYEGVPS